MQKLKGIFTVAKKLLSPLREMPGSSIAVGLLSIYQKVHGILWIQVTALIIGAIEMGSPELLTRYLRFLGALSLFRILKMRGFNYFQPKLFVYLKTFINKKTLNKFIKLDNNKVEGYGTGRLNNIVFKGAHNWSEILVASILGILGDAIAIIYGFVIIFQSVKIRFGFLFLGVFVVGMILTIISFTHPKKYRKLAKEINIKLDRWKVKILMTKFEIFQNNKMPQETETLNTLTDSIFSARWKHNKLKARRQTGIDIINNGTRILLYIIFGFGVISGNYTISYLVLLTGLLGMMTRYLWNIRFHIKTIFKGMIHVEKLRDVIDKTPLVESSEKKKSFEFKDGNIEVKNIKFTYGEDEKIFEDFSITIQGKKKTALVGESGSGKSTLVKLLSGYLHIDDGEILVDGQRFRDVSLQSFYQHVGYLTQEPSVFDGTVLENLCYALDEGIINNKEGRISPAFEKKLHQVLKDAKCQFLFDFEHGLETEIGEKGIRLSGGQKQRLAIAKIMLKDPKMIFLDEPTSALDSTSEQKVSDALHNLFHGRTVVVVAHRLQTVKEADEIVVLEKGEIIEKGNHQTLAAQDGVYKRMLDLQTSF